MSQIGTTALVAPSCLWPPTIMKSRRWSNSRNSEPRFRSASASRRFGHRHLYWLYGLCNHYGWSETLPPVALILNRSRRPTHVAGYANPQATAVNGRVYGGISLTLTICARANTSSFIPILLHEMTHVWQFSKGQRGGHGKGFRDEMLRLGIDEVGQGPLRAGSPAVRIMQEAELRHPGLAARMRECLASPLPSTKQEDFAFFRMVLESGNK